MEMFKVNFTMFSKEVNVYGGGICLEFRWAQAKRDRQAKRPRLFMAAETSLANRASELETNWQQESHPSLAQAQCALACAEKSTLPSVRVLAYAKLKGRAEPASTLASNSLPKLVSDVLGEHFPIHYTTLACDGSPPEIGAGMPSTFFAEHRTDNLHQRVAAMVAEADTKTRAPKPVQRIQPPWTKHTSDSPGKYNHAKPSQAVTLHPRRRILKSQLRSLIGR